MTDKRDDFIKWIMALQRIASSTNMGYERSLKQYLTEEEYRNAEYFFDNLYVEDLPNIR